MKAGNKIKSIKAREILDSRGNPTVEVELTTDSGVFVSSAPSGASTGKYEAMELRDGGKRYHGKGALKAVENVNKVIALKLKNKDATEQEKLDELMIDLDGTENKIKLGANAILPVSMTVCRAGAAAQELPLYKHLAQLAENSSPPNLPHPCFNVINGGAHAGNDLDIQEFMMAPQFEKFSENLKAGSEIYHQLKEILKKEYGSSAINVGDEGGFAPPLKDPEETLVVITRASRELGYDKDIKIILDIAASQFFTISGYKMKIGDFTKEELLDYYGKLIKKYPICGLEDPFAEDDWESFQKLTANLGKEILIIGDDLITTNPDRIKTAKEKDACNAMILKPNQIGTVSEAIEAAKLAKSFNWKIVVSHRSGETCDDFIADLAVGIGADFIKSGAPARGERLAKYNRLLKIEAEIAKF